jgi:Reverse transcriptase (RNA-dependent DNA polymerase)
LCPVQDYCHLNEHTIWNTYPLPLILELITQVRGTWVYTKFDIRWGYIKEGDQWKAAFKMCFSLFQPEIMYFGQCNSPATFQTFMNMIMIQTQDKHSLKGTEIIVYMDDILITTKEGATIEDHRATTWDILQVLQDHDLFLKPEKCVWESCHEMMACAAQLECLRFVT